MSSTPIELTPAARGSADLAVDREQLNEEYALDQNEPNYPYPMHDWCIEKAASVVQQLAAAMDAINRLPSEAMTDVDGLPTPMGDLAANAAGAIYDATKLLAYHVGVQWTVQDASAIQQQGTAGYAHLAARYGLALPPPTADMAEDDPRRLVVRTAWLYEDQDLGGWAWAYHPAMVPDSAEVGVIRRGYPDRVAAQAAAARAGYLTASLPQGRPARRLGPRYRYVAAPIYAPEDIEALNRGELTLEEIVPIPAGAQVELIGLDHDVFPVVRYGDREVVVHDPKVVVLAPPATPPDAFQMIFWRTAEPIVVRDPARLGAIAPPYAEWRFETFDLNRPLDGVMGWAGAIYTEEQQRRALAAARTAVQAFVERLPHQDSVVLSGPVGAGKSHLAFAAAYAAAAGGLHVGYINGNGLPIRWRPSDRLALAAFRDLDLLIVDELIHETEPGQTSLIGMRPLVELIAERTTLGRPSLLVSLLPREHVPEKLRAALPGEIVVPASSYRRVRRLMRGRAPDEEGIL